MNKLKTTTFGILLSIAGASLSMSALALNNDALNKEHRIEINADPDKDAHIFVISDGDKFDVTVPASDWQDKAQLEQHLAELPDDIRGKVVEQLSNINLDANVIKVGTGSDSSVFSFSGGDNEKVIVMDIEEVIEGALNETDHALVHAKKVIEKLKGDGSSAIYKFKFDGAGKANAIASMLEKGKFTQEELDKIQQALDGKR